MKFITLLTDFGLKDGNVGVMKGVIWASARKRQIADLSHTISPQNITEGRWCSPARCLTSRPAASTWQWSTRRGHLPPPDRRPIGGALFRWADNGLVTLLLERAEGQEEMVQFVHLDNPHYWLPK